MNFLLLLEPFPMWYYRERNSILYQPCLLLDIDYQAYIQICKMNISLYARHYYRWDIFLLRNTNNILTFLVPFFGALPIYQFFPLPSSTWISLFLWLYSFHIFHHYWYTLLSIILPTSWWIPKVHLVSSYKYKWPKKLCTLIFSTLVVKLIAIIRQSQELSKWKSKKKPWLNIFHLISSGFHLTYKSIEKF